MIRLRVFFLSLLFFVNCQLNAGSISKGYQALKIYNYFEAKRLFEKSLSKEKTSAAFGLSIIYFRSDNPFSNIDSAYKYIIISSLVLKNISILKRIKKDIL